MTDLLYEKSVNVIDVPIVDDKTDAEESASSFTKAEYVLYDVTGREKIRLSLGDGIEVSGDNFVVTLTFDMMSQSFSGPHFHQLVVYNQRDQRIPPLFRNEVDFEKVL